MQNGEATDANAAKAAPEEVTKHTLRVQVWRHLEASALAMFPRPVYNRIPNFKGAGDAAARLAELDVFKSAVNVRVNPDKPQEAVRIKCLEQKKNLYVPARRQQSGYISRVEPPEDVTDNRKVVSRKGSEDYGKSVGIEEPVTLDIVVIGSVAVSKEGYRIGKGRGYSDLEFGLMMHMKAIKPSTVVITTVHDSQVFDTLPAELFGPHDVPIDIIVTPTQVIETQRMSQRPTGLLWHLLSNRRLTQMPVLAQLREIEMLAGRACTLKEEDTDVEERAVRRARRSRRRTRSHPQPHSDAEKDEGNTTEGEGGESKPRRKPRHRENKSAPAKEGDAPAKPRRVRKPRPTIDFSVKVSNISPNTRVRDLKLALSERGVKPQIMVWKGFRGFCYLHFVKPTAQKGEGDVAPAAPPTLESVLTSLAALSVSEGARGEGDGDADAAPAPAPAPYALLVEAAPPRQPRGEAKLREPKDALGSGKDALVAAKELIVAPTAELTAV